MKAATLFFIAVFTLATTALAIEPPPGGGYPNNVTALGDDALFNLQTTGTECTAIGFETLYSNLTGDDNIAVGDQALYGNTEGSANVAIGTIALYHNNGDSNIAIGGESMLQNTTGSQNVGIGDGAMSSSTTGMQNSAIGFGAMSFSTTASYNAAFGADALSFDSTGSYDTALGRGAMNRGTGSKNVAVGYGAGSSLTGDKNIAIGYNAASNLTAATSSNNIEIGTLGTSNDANVVRLGDPTVQRKAFVAGISRATVADGTPVVVNNKGQLGVATSSARFKREIKPMSNSSEAILSLQPVTFRYNEDVDSEAIPQFGLVAEDVAKVDSELVVKDDQGKPYTVRYEAVNAMLLNEFLKEHKKVEEQAEKVEAQAKVITQLKAALKEVTARIDAKGL